MMGWWDRGSWRDGCQKMKITMQIISIIAWFLLAVSLNACTWREEATVMPSPLPITSNSQVPDFKPEEAEARLREHIAGIPPSKDAMVARVRDLDVAGLYAFSVIPSTGLAGEVYYLLGPTEMLTSGWPSDFDKIMKRLGVGQNPEVLDVHTFARFFLPLCALRRGVVLEHPNGHILLRLRPELLPSGQFSPPRVDFDANGTRYRFWTFDADRMESVFWDVQVAPDGTTSFTSNSWGQ